MEMVYKQVKHRSRKDWFDIIPLGDVHLGNAGCDVDKFQRQIRWIAENKKCFWIGMGDYVDAINYSDKRFDQNTVAEPYRSDMMNCVTRQIDDIKKMLDPIMPKCLGMLRGNHEEKIRRAYHHDLIYEFWREYHMPILNDAAIIRLSFNDLYGKRRSFDFFCTHGNVGGRKSGAKLNRLEDLIGYIDADVYLIAHSHMKATSCRSVLFMNDAHVLKHKKKVMAVTGCFLNGYTEGVGSYIEKWMYPPTSTGVVKIMLNPDKRDIHISE